MATSSLIVELDARTKKLEDKLTSTEKKLDGLGKKTKESSGSLKKFGGIAAATGTVLLKTAAAAVAVVSAISAITLKAASSRRELEQLSRQAKTSAEDFQALAFATNSFGINAEQIADISKDVSDKVGEFSAVGTGAFQDYADVMKLTKEEAKAVAVEFEGLSSQQVIGKMVSEMEAAGVTGSKMTFALESMGNDLSKLIPLFANNSSELVKMKARFNDVNSTLQITAGQAEKLKEVSTSFDLLTSGLGNAATAISATIAPVVDEFFNDIIDIVPDATQTIIDFANSFLDAENITSIAAVNKEIVSSTKEMVKQKSIIDKGLNPRATAAAKRLLTSEKERLAALEAQLVVLQDQETLADAKRSKGGDIGGLGVAGGAGTGDQIQAITDRFKTEEALLSEKLDRELEIIGDNDELKEQLHQEYLDNIFNMEEEADEKKNKIDADGLAERAKLKDKAGKAEIALETSVAKNSIALAKMVLGDNKATALAGLVIQKAMALSANATSTLSGSLLAFSSQLVPGDPTSVARAEAARNYTLGLGTVNAGLIIATGLGEAAGITSSGGGGFSGGGGGSVQDSQAGQQDFQAETSSLELSDSSTSGSRVFNINVPEGDEIGEAIANWLNKAQTEGRVK